MTGRLYEITWFASRIIMQDVGRTRLCESSYNCSLDCVCMGGGRVSVCCLGGVGRCVRACVCVSASVVLYIRNYVKLYFAEEIGAYS